MGWRRATLNENVKNIIHCSKCNAPLQYAMRADNSGAYDFPLRLAPHECVKKRKQKEVKVYINPYLNR